MTKEWKEIHDMSMDYMENGLPNEALVFDVYPGGGKTVNVIQAAMSTGLKFIYLSPTHEVIHQNLEFHPLEDYVGAFEHFKGRARVCLNEDYRKNAETYGMPIKPLCGICEHKDNGCPYYEVRRKIESNNPMSWAGVHAHIATYLKHYLFDEEDDRRFIDQFDLIIMEENPIATLMNRNFLTSSDLVRLEREINDNFLPNFNKDEMFTMHCHLLFDLIDQFILGLQKLRIDVDKLWEIAVQWRDLEWEPFMDMWDKFLVIRIREQGMTNPPQMIYQILNDIFSTTNRENLEYHIGIVNDTWSERKKRFITLNYYYGDILRNVPLLTIGLDGTANKTVWTKMLGKHCNFVEIGYKYNNVYQISSGGYPISTLVKSKELQPSGKKLVDIALKIVKRRPGKTLVVGSKRLMPHFETRAKKKGISNYKYGLYYSLRSKNNYQDCDTVILMMRPSPPVHQIKTYAQLSGWDEDIWKRFFIRDEMIQALARVRQNMVVVKDAIDNERGRDRVEIYIFSNEQIFNEGEVRDGGHYLMTRASLHYFVETGHIGIASRNDVKIRNAILDYVEDGPKKKIEILQNVEMPTVVKRMLSRMCAHKDLVYMGGRYGRP